MKEKKKSGIWIPIIVLVIAILVVLYITPVSPFKDADKIDFLQVYICRNADQTEITDQIDITALARSLPALQTERFPTQGNSILLGDVSYHIRLHYSQKPYDIYIGTKDMSVIGTGHISKYKIQNSDAWNEILDAFAGE